MPGKKSETMSQLQHSMMEKATSFAENLLARYTNPLLFIITTQPLMTGYW
jgi:hypothetical protein